MNIEFYATIFVYGVIAFLACLVAWELYKSDDGMLRKLLIAFFICKVWLNIGEIAYTYLRHYGVLTDLSLTWMLVLNFPMAWVMVMLYGYIRGKK